MRDVGAGERLAGFRFGRFDFDALRLELRCDGALLDVEPKPLAVLVELVRAAGEVVTKSRLMDTVWGGRPVTDHVLTRCINRLRAALGDEGSSLIANVYGQGYRFTAPVVVHSVPALIRPMLYAPVVDDAIAARPHWRLEQALDAPAGVWLARHSKTKERRVFKFALTPDRIFQLKREVTVYRLLAAALGPAPEFSRLLEYNLEGPPYAIELEWSEAGSLLDWSERLGGLATLGLDQRLELLAGAAESLARAHAAGILHLDVKPANMLVWLGSDGTPRIRWTDFGSGRLLDAQLLDQFSITMMGTRTAAATESGTLLYIAPEVIGGEPATALSDVYALGVMLYQLVCGDLRRPLSAGWDQDVSDPLLREDIAAAANGDPSRRTASALDLARSIRTLPERRELAARKEEEDRHAATLARELERVRARRPWIVALTLMLALALSGSLWAYAQVRSARDRAQTEAANALQVTLFYADDILGASSVFNPDVSRDITVREAIDRAARRIDTAALPPLAEARVRSLLSRAYMQESQHERAQAEGRRAVALYAQALGPEDAATIGMECLLAEILLFDDQFDAALAALDGLDAKLAGRTDLDPELTLASAALRGAVHFAVGRYAQALPYYQRARVLFEQLHPGQSAGLAARLEMLSLTLVHLGQFDQANALARQALAAAGAEPGAAREGAVALAQMNLGQLAYLEGRHADALPLLDAARSALTVSLGADVPETLDTEASLAWVLGQRGDWHRALDLARHARDGLVRRHGAANTDAANAAVSLGVAQLALGEDLKAVASLRPAYELLGRLEGEGAPDTALAGYYLARALTRTDPAAARAVHDRVSASALALALPGRAWSRQAPP